MMAGTSIALLLIAGAVGYKVLLQAEELKKDAKMLKSCGRILGVVIIAISLAAILCLVYKARYCKGYGMGYHNRCLYKKMCPAAGSYSTKSGGYSCRVKK